MTKRFSPQYLLDRSHGFADEPEQAKMIETINGEYVTYESHKVTATLYNKTLKNYQDLKTKSKWMEERIAELEKLVPNQAVNQ